MQACLFSYYLLLSPEGTIRWVPFYFTAKGILSYICEIAVSLLSCKIAHRVKA